MSIIVSAFIVLSLPALIMAFLGALQMIAFIAAVIFIRLTMPFAGAFAKIASRSETPNRTL